MKKEKASGKFNLNPWVVWGIVLLTVFVIYGNTIGNQYCLDDAVVITGNKFVDKGVSGIPDIFSTESFTGFFGRQKDLVSGSRYRPFSIATFALEKQIFGGYEPWFSHFMNILLFAITCFIIYLLLNKLIQKNKPEFAYLPVFATLLFVFHPIHTEVVANIKGRDELLALLFSLIACYSILKYIELKKIRFLASGAILWFLGLLSKENAIVFFVLLPMVLYMYGLRNRKDYVSPMLSFSITLIVFLVIRHAVLGNSSGVPEELMNNSFLQATSPQKFATIFYTLWRYIQLLFFPVHLTFDYYPYHIALSDWGNFGSLAGAFSYIAMVFWMFLSIRKNFLITFSLTIYLLPLILVSNLFFPIGTFMSERFLYFSSVGFCILVSIGMVHLISPGIRSRFMVYSGFAVILILSGIKTINRNKDWYNDFTLFTTDVKTSFDSAKSNCSAGGALLESTDTIKDPQRRIAVLDQSIRYLRKSVSIHPKYADAWLLLGNAYFKKDVGVDSVIFCYTRILNNNPENDLALKNMQSLADREKNPDIKILILKKMADYQPNGYQIYNQLGRIYGKDKNDPDQSIFYLSKAMILKPDEKDVYVNLGVAYGMKHDFLKSADMLQKAVEIDPSDANGFINLGVTYQNLGQSVKAAACFKKAEELKKGIRIKE